MSNNLLEPSTQRRPSKGSFNNAIANHLASGLVGQTVSLLNRSHRISHGVVAGIIQQAGRPKLIVNRHEYDLSQVLSVTPPTFN